MSYTNRKFTWDFDSLKRYNRLYSAIYDVSANNSGATFASLNALLSNENLDTLIPASVRKGGMSIKFVQTSDNNYVQFRYMSSSTAVADFINVANWQGVDDEPTAGSENLVKSGGVLAWSNRFQLVGQGMQLVSTKIYGLVKGRNYRIVFTPFTFTNSSTVVLFELLGFTGTENYEEIYSVTANKAERIKRVIDFTCGEYDYVKVNIRADEGEKVIFEILDITEDSEGFYYRRFGKNYFNAAGYITNNGRSGFSDGISLCSEFFIPVEPYSTYIISNIENYLIGVAYYGLEKNYLSGSWFDNITLITVPENCYYIILMIRKTEGLTIETMSGFVGLQYKEPVADSVVYDWMLSESFTIRSISKDANDNVSSVNITWLDGLNGVLTITRDSNENATSLSGTYNGHTYTINITRDSDGNVTSTNKIKS